MPRRRSFAGVEPGGAAVINRDNRSSRGSRAAAQAAGVDAIVAFGEQDEADARLVKASLQADTLDRAGAASSVTT